MAVRGNIVQAATFDGGAGFLTVDGAGPQTLTGTSTTVLGALPNLTVTKPAGTDPDFGRDYPDRPQLDCHLGDGRPDHLHRHLRRRSQRHRQPALTWSR